MMSRTPLRLRAAGRQFARPSAHPNMAPVLVPVAMVATTTCLFLPVALSSPAIAVVLMGMLGLLGYAIAAGLDRASTLMLTLAFGFAPLTLATVGPALLSAANIFFVAAFFLALPRLLREPLRLPGTFMLGAALLVIMGLVSAPFAINAAVSLGYLLLAAIGLIIGPAVVGWMAPTNRQMWVMMIAFCIGTAISTLYGLPRNSYRNAGFTYHPVALAYTSMMALSFVPYLLTLKVRGRWLVVPPLAAVAVVGVWTSGSRTGLVVLAALTVLVPILDRSLRLGIVVVTSAVLAMPTALRASVDTSGTTALSRLFGGGGAQNSDTVREDTLRQGLEMVQQSPIIGNGFSVEHTYVIHNIYLQILAAEGLFGLIGLLLILSAFVAPLRKVSPPRRALVYPALAAILAGPFQPNTGDPFLMLPLGLAMVVAVGHLRGSSGRTDVAAQDGGDSWSSRQLPTPKSSSTIS